MSVAEMCALAELSRAGYYRFLTTPAGGDKDVDLRDAIQRIALEFSTYGRPRMTAELHRRGWRVGPNRVYRILREDNLLCLISACGARNLMKTAAPVFSTLPAEAEVPHHHRLCARSEGLSEPGAESGAHRHGPTLGG